MRMEIDLCKKVLWASLTFLLDFFILFWKNNIHRKIIDLVGDASQID